MATSGVSVGARSESPASSAYRLAYKVFAYFGLFSIFGRVMGTGYSTSKLPERVWRF